MKRSRRLKKKHVEELHENDHMKVHIDILIKVMSNKMKLRHTFLPISPLYT